VIISMNISVYGLGYVGCVSAACLAHLGHNVTGVDLSEEKVTQVNKGKSPLVEADLDDMIRSLVTAGRLRATTDSDEAIRNTEISLICVGTPSNGNGSLKLDYIQSVCRDIGASLSRVDRYHTIVVRSTVLPETSEEKLIPLIEQQSGRRSGTDFGYAINPEFLRESSAIQDFFHPSQIVIGALDERTMSEVERLYVGLSAPIVSTTIKSAEMIKYVCNAFHALKIVFANEIGNVCKSLGTDGREIMEIFCRDRQLNISPAYLKPGFGFGGSCLPKDMRALLHAAKQRDIECPLLQAVLDSNQQQIQRGIDLVEHTGRKKIGVLGLSFKAGTDDIRESAAVPLVETLVGRGYEVCIFDRDVRLENLVGGNKRFVERELPHIALLMRDCVEDVVAQSEVVVLTNSHGAYHAAHKLMRDGQVLIDLVGIPHDGRTAGSYQGICW
jgi:GDP-mannose 6-dehydrogenase